MGAVVTGRNVNVLPRKIFYGVMLNEKENPPMAKTKLERIANVENEIKALENQRKRLIQQQKEQERKERTNRLCRRGGYLESRISETVMLTDEQFHSFIEGTLLTPFARKILNGFLQANADATKVENAITESQAETHTVTKPANAEQRQAADADNTIASEVKTAS
jgi:hypothetical protein